MLDIEEKITKSLEGCFFSFTSDGKVMNVGKGFAPWESERATRKKLETRCAIPPRIKLPTFEAGRVPKVSDIVAAVAAVTEIPAKDFMSQSRTRRFIRPRQAVYRLARMLSARSWHMLSEKFEVHHTTIIHAVLHLPPESEVKVTAIVEEASEALRKQFPDFDAVVTKVKEAREQSLNGDECHESHGE